MCRLAAWLGPPKPLSALTHDPPHSLLVQSYRPREMREATLNADGSGAAWYPDDGDPNPARYRAHTPIWSDENLASLAPRIRSRCLLAVVRSATPGLEVGSANTAPFVKGRVAFAHNGYLEKFRTTFMRPVRELLSDASYEVIVGGTDSEHVFALLLQELGTAAGADALASATRRVLASCAQLGDARDAKAILNVVVTDGTAIVASKFSSRGPNPSLYVRRAELEASTLLLASEPLDAAAEWTSVPDNSLVIADGRSVRIEAV